MGLFGLGKKKENEKKPFVATQMQQTVNIPSLPEFPSLDEEGSFSEFPKYEPSVADIKKEVSKSSDDDLVIPIRNQDFTGKKMVASSPQLSEQFTSLHMESAPRRSFGDEKPLFVKIDNYKQAMHTLDALKSKLDDAEQVLKAFEEIKFQEDEKLEAWKRDLQNMKDKLFSMDKELFEV